MKRVAVLLAALTMMAAWQSGAVAAFSNWLCAQQTPQPSVPAGWPAPHYRFDGNPVTRAGFELGRALFYEPRLSRDNSLACANCHQQFAAFAHYDHRVSHGIGGVDGTRNAPGLFNLAWQPDFMWDGAIGHLELQPLGPISNPVEMGETLANVVGKLQADAGYQRRFEQAFGTPGIDGQRVLLALTQFIGTLQSSHSRYDAYRKGEGQLSANELRGLQVFRAQCASCHREPLFTDYSYRNNGLDREPADEGRAGITRHSDDRGRFRVPSLRNVALTAPYMHDGRYATLDDVLDHYASGIQPSATLDPQLRQGLQLSATDRAALRHFLDTLTDTAFVSDPRFADAGVHR